MNKQKMNIFIKMYIMNEYNNIFKEAIYDIILEYNDIETVLIVVKSIGYNRYKPEKFLKNIDLKLEKNYKQILNLSYKYDDINLYKYMYKYFDKYKTRINNKCIKIIVYNYLLTNDYIFLRNCILDNYISYIDLYYYGVVSDKLILSHILYAQKHNTEILYIIRKYSHFFEENETFNLQTYYFKHISFIKKNGVMISNNNYTDLIMY